jgi:OFA family oxalate/formate antiporter-like MFS transporter
LAFFTFGEIFSLFPSTCTDLFGSGYATANASLLYTAKGTSVLLIWWANETLLGNGHWHAIFMAAAGANVLVVLLALLVLRPARALRHRREEALVAGA